MAHAAPSRRAPTASTDLDAGGVLNLGEYSDVETLSLSEARIVLLKTLEARAKHTTQAAAAAAVDVASGKSGTGTVTSTGSIAPYAAAVHETEVTSSIKDYLEIFAIFKDLGLASQVESVINGSLGDKLVKFEKAQMKSLLPTCSEEAQALIPSLEIKVNTGVLSRGELDDVCAQLQRLKRQAEL